VREQSCMIYTCYEMVSDCRADRAEGWSFFISNYVPVLRKLLAHYFPERAQNQALLDRLLTAIRKPESSIFGSLEPSPERWFIAELRQAVLAAMEAGSPSAEPEISIGLEALGAALEPLTVTEKHAVWLETMRYGPGEAGAMLRMAPETVERIREKAASLIRASVDSWRASLLADNGFVLGPAAAAAGNKNCPRAKVFLDMLDGRSTWRMRDETERHATACWRCIDHFCRLVEAVDLLRGSQPLTEAEAAPFRNLLGIGIEKMPAWKRWFSGR
jgi:hypothetical protein